MAQIPQYPPPQIMNSGIGEDKILNSAFSENQYDQIGMNNQQQLNNPNMSNQQYDNNQNFNTLTSNDAIAVWADSQTENNPNESNNISEGKQSFGNDYNVRDKENNNQQQTNQNKGRRTGRFSRNNNGQFMNMFQLQSFTPQTFSRQYFPPQPIFTQPQPMFPQQPYGGMCLMIAPQKNMRRNNYKNNNYHQNNNNSSNSNNDNFGNRQVNNSQSNFQQQNQNNFQNNQNNSQRNQNIVQGMKKDGFSAPRRMMNNNVFPQMMPVQPVYVPVMYKPNFNNGKRRYNRNKNMNNQQQNIGNNQKLLDGIPSQEDHSNEEQIIN